MERAINLAYMFYLAIMGTVFHRSASTAHYCGGVLTTFSKTLKTKIALEVHFKIKKLYKAL